MPSYITYSIAEDIPSGNVTLSDLEQEVRASEVLDANLFAYAETNVGGDPDAIRLVLSRDPNQTELDELDIIVSSHEGKPIDHTKQVSILGPQTSDGKMIVSLWPTEGSRKTIISHNWADPSTWITFAKRITNESPNEITPGLVYEVTENHLIDTFHGKVWEEDGIDSSYRVLVETSSDGGSNWTARVEEDPHVAEATGGDGDYVVDYATGIITFHTTIGSDDVRVSYYYADLSDPDASHFVIAPIPGKTLKLRKAEVQFTTDIELTDTVIFETRGYADVFAPHLLTTADPPGPFPPGTKIPIATTTYKTTQDYYNEANGAQPTYPALGGSGWRGVGKDVVVLQWDYAAVLPVSSAAGMEVHIFLEHNRPFGGTYATATVYGLSEDE